jgi:hypothetical protein
MFRNVGNCLPVNMALHDRGTGVKSSNLARQSESYLSPRHENIMGAWRCSSTHFSLIISFTVLTEYEAGWAPELVWTVFAEEKKF